MTIDLPEAPNPIVAPIAETATTDDVSIVRTAPAESQEVTAPAASDQREMPELELLDQLWTAYRAQLEAAIEQQSAAIAAERAKEEYDRSKEKTEVRRQEVKTLLDSFCERLAAIRDPQSAAMIAQVQSSVEDQPGSTMIEAHSPNEEIEVSDWNEWCKIPTQVVIQDIAGLGEKKATFLVEEFPTIGDLEAARVEADKTHRHFCKVLGKGFGEKTGDAILDAMQKLLKITPASTEVTRNASEKSKPTEEATAQPPTSQAADRIAPANDAADSEESLGTVASELGAIDEYDDGNLYEDVDGDTDDLYAETDDSDDEEDMSDDGSNWAEEFHQKLLSDPKESRNGWGDSDKTHSEAWTKGNKAQESWPVSACPYDETSELEEAIDWVRGWTAAEMLAMDL